MTKNVSLMKLRNPPRCRWADCQEFSEFFAVGNRAKFGHLCLLHWRDYLSRDEQALYDNRAQGLLEASEAFEAFEWGRDDAGEQHVIKQGDPP